MEDTSDAASDNDEKIGDEHFLQYVEESSDNYNDQDHDFFLEAATNGTLLDEEEEDNDGWSFKPFVSPDRQTIERLDAVELRINLLRPKLLSAIKKYLPKINKCKTKREQIVMTVNILRPNDGKPLASWDEIGRMFYLTKGAVRTHYIRGIETREVGRTSTLCDSEINMIINFIYEQFNAGVPVTYDDVEYFIEEKTDKVLQQSTLYKLIKRIKQLKQVDGHPMDSKRTFCPPEAIDEYYDKLEKLLSQGIPAPFVINIDECGCNEWVDTSDIKVIVPKEFSRNSIEIPVPRNSKTSSILAGICCDGTTIRPGIAIHRKTVETELFQCGYLNDKVNIYYQEKGFFNTDCFQQWAEKCLFPEIRERRKKYNYDGLALVILDGFEPHNCDFFLDECTYNNVCPLFLPPHSSDQCQPLDFVIFQIQKSKLQRMRVDSRLDPQTQKLIKMIDSLSQATTISNVINAFKGAGIDVKYDREKNMLYPFVNKALAKKVRHWAYSQDTDFNKKKN